MGNRKRALVALVLSALISCDAASSEPGDEGSAAPEDAAPAPLKVSFSGRVVSRVEGGSEEPGPALVGAELCVYGQEDRSPCATTDADGMFMLEQLPFNSELAITLDADGFRPMVIPHVTGVIDVVLPLSMAIQMWPADAQDFDTNVHIDPQLAGILTRTATLTKNATTSFLADVVDVGLALEPAAGVGPFFSDRFDVWDADETEGRPDGHGLWVNLPIPDDGEYRVRFIKPLNPLLDCWVGGSYGGYDDGGFPTDRAGEEEFVVRAPVVSGYFTRVTATCLPLICLQGPDAGTSCELPSGP